MIMLKYLYLTRPEWAEAWVAGGEVPIALASTYRSEKRFGTLTPDENLIHESPVDVSSLSQYGYSFPPNMKNLTFKNNVLNSQLLPSFENANYYVEDGLILSFSNIFSIDICKRLGKTACVEIIDIEKLKMVIDGLLGVTGQAKDCEYTSDHQRNHFLKSVEDEWQQEFRIFWPVLEAKKIVLPPDMARRMDITHSSK